MAVVFPSLTAGSRKLSQQHTRTMDHYQNSTGIEMPRYRSHKTVWALKIRSLELDSERAKAENRETDGSATITPEEKGYAPFRVDAAYVEKHKPQAGGYFVAYADGYKSWSPAEAFEGGYTRIAEPAVPRRCGCCCGEAKSAHSKPAEDTEKCYLGPGDYPAGLPPESAGK